MLSREKRNSGMGVPIFFAICFRSLLKIVASTNRDMKQGKNPSATSLRQQTYFMSAVLSSALSRLQYNWTYKIHDILLILYLFSWDSWSSTVVGADEREAVTASLVCLCYDKIRKKRKTLSSKGYANWCQTVCQPLFNFCKHLPALWL